MKMADPLDLPVWIARMPDELVTASVESLQRQVAAAKDHYMQLISLAEKIGKD
jgi:hypothetical protein